MRRSSKNLKASEKQLVLETLTGAASQMRGPTSTLTFIDTLLTESEKITIGRRILIAHMILAGETQREISNILSVSPNTVSLTRKWLEEQIPNYSDVVQKTAEEAASKRAKRRKPRKEYANVNPLTFAGLRRRYPGHFLLFNVADEVMKRFNKDVR